MKENLYKFMQNETKSTLLKYIMHFIIFIVVFDQFISLSHFAYNYTKFYDFGNLMKKTCDSNYTEYETARFHITNNTSDMKIKNDMYSNNFFIFILIVSCIVSLFISYTFVYLFTENISNNGISNIINAYYSGNFMDNITELFSGISSIKTIIIFIFKALCVIYIMFIIPLTLLLIYINNINISPFFDTTQNPDTKTIIFLSLHILFAISIFVTHNVFYMKVSYLTNIISFVLFYVFYWYIFNMFDIYSISIAQNNINTGDNNDKKQNEINFNNIYSSNFQIPDQNILLKYFYKIFGLEFVKKSFSYMNAILLIIIASILILYIILYLFKQPTFTMYGFFDIQYFDMDYLYYLVIVPIVVLYITNIIIIATKEYNTIINQYILYKPSNLYKYSIKDINTVFNTIVENDKANIQNNSLCPNYVNAINLIIYSTILGDYKGLKFIPSFEYTTNCETGKYIDYTSKKEYDMDFYLQKQNIFYQDDRCSSVNNEILKTIIKNLIPKYDLKITDDDFLNYNNLFKKKILFGIYNIKYGKIYDGTKQLIKTNDYHANNKIVSINDKQLNSFDDNYLNENNNTLNVVQKICDIFDNYSRKTYDNIRKTIQNICRCNKQNDFTDNGYDVFMQKVNYTIDNYNGEYSLNIKKDFIEKFIISTRSSMQKINEILSNDKVLTTNNFRLTKYIVKNYNSYQEEKFNKHFKDKFISVVATENIQINKYENIEEIIETITEIDKLIYEYANYECDNDREIHKYDLIEKISKLQHQNNNFQNTVDIQKNINASDDYIMDSVANFKKEFLQHLIILFLKIKEGINNNRFKQIDKTSRSSADILANSTDAKPIDLMSLVTTLSFNEYKKTYDNIFTTYENAIIVISKLNNDSFKTDTTKNTSPENLEEYNNNILNTAYSTSYGIYLLFVLYFINELMVVYMVN